MASKVLKRNALVFGSAMRAIALLGAGGVAATAMIAPAAAQDFTNVTASGKVVGTDGENVAGARVVIRSLAQGFSRETTTDSGGSFRFPLLPTGTYSFEVSADGFETYTDEGVLITTERTSNQFSLAPIGAGGDIVVTAGRTQIVDFQRNTTGSVIEVGELATRVPVARDITSVVLLAPGTTQGDSAFGNLPNIQGASVAENAYYVNGLNITEFREGLGAVAIPFEFYETVEVKAGGYSAEFGRATGGIINAVTKSGTNELHAGVLVNWQPDFLRDNAKDTVFSENSREQSDRVNTTFTLSGPVIKDRLFFFGLYETRNITSTNTLTGHGRVGSTDQFRRTGTRFDENSTNSPFWGVKIDAIPIDGQRLEFTYFDSTSKTVQNSFGYNAFDSLDPGAPFAGDGIPGQPGQGAAEGQAVFGAGGENFVGRYIGNFTDWLTLSAAYGINKNRDTVGSSDDTRPFIFDNRTQQSLGNSVYSISRSLDEREFYRADADVQVSFFGNHAIRFGYDREQLTTNTTNSRTGGANFTFFNSGPTGDANIATPNIDYVTARTFINGGVFKSENQAFYVQDNWSLLDDRLNLNLGLRNDRFQNQNVVGEVYFKSGNNWAPRLGFSADVFGDRSTKVYGSFGRYFLPVAANTNIRLAGSELDFTRFNVLTGLNPDNTPIIGAPLDIVTNATACPAGGGNNCQINSDGVVADAIAATSRSLTAQSVDEYILGAERRLSSLWSAGVYYTRTRLNRALEDAAVDAAINAYCVREGITGCDDIWSAFHQYVLVNPGEDATITLSDPINGETTLRTVDFTAKELGMPKATRRYDAVTFKVDRAFDGKWSLSSSYTWSRLFGNYEGGVKSDNGQTDSGLTTDFDQPGFTLGATGLSPNHRRHNFKLFGSYQPFDWLTIGGNFSATSRRKFGCIGRIPANVDPFAQFYGAAGNFCNADADGNIITDERTGVRTNTSGQLFPRGTVFESDWLTQTNLSFVFRLPITAFQSDFRIDVFNLFNEKAALDFIERGTLGNGLPNNNFQQVFQFQGPRSVRLQLGLRF